MRSDMVNEILDEGALVFSEALSEGSTNGE